MSGTFPTDPAPSAASLTSQAPTLVTTTHNLARQVRSRGGQRFGLKLAWQNRTRAEMAPLLAFAAAQRGQYGSFQIVPPLIDSTRGTASACTCNGATASGRAVPVNLTGTLKAGDLIKFANHAKVYLLTADAAAGTPTLAIEPALVAAVSNTEVVTVSSVPLTMAFASDGIEVTLRAGQLYDWSCDLVEAP